MKQLLEAIRAKYLCLHDWEVVSKTEYDCGYLSEEYEQPSLLNALARYKWIYQYHQ